MIISLLARSSYIVKLRNRWEGQENRIDAIIEAMKSDQDWTIYLGDHNLNPYGPLPLADDDKVPISLGAIYPRDFRGIKLHNKDLSKVKTLSGTSFEYSRINTVDFSQSILFGVNFKNAKLNNVDFESSRLAVSDFSKARLNNVRFMEADLEKVILYDSFFRKCTFTGAIFSAISFNEEPALGHILLLLGVKKGTKVCGFLHDVEQHIFKAIDYNFLEFLRDQHRIERIKRSGRIFAAIYYFFTGYGKSFRRLAIMLLLMWSFFGFVYAGYPMPPVIQTCKPCEKLLTSLKPDITWGSGDKPDHWFSPYFFSITTSATVSFGDIKPADLKAKILVCIEIVMGYLFLGMFVAMILSYGGGKRKIKL